MKKGKCNAHITKLRATQPRNGIAIKVLIARFGLTVAVAKLIAALAGIGSEKEAA